MSSRLMLDFSSVPYRMSAFDVCDLSSFASTELGFSVLYECHAAHSHRVLQEKHRHSKHTEKQERYNDVNAKKLIHE